MSDDALRALYDLSQRPWSSNHNLQPWSQSSRSHSIQSRLHPDSWSESSSQGCWSRADTQLSLQHLSQEPCNQSQADTLSSLQSSNNRRHYPQARPNRKHGVQVRPSTCPPPSSSHMTIISCPGCYIILVAFTSNAPNLCNTCAYGAQKTAQCGQHGSGQFQRQGAVAFPHAHAPQPFGYAPSVYYPGVAPQQPYYSPM